MKAHSLEQMSCRCRLVPMNFETAASEYTLTRDWILPDTSAKQLARRQRFARMNAGQLLKMGVEVVVNRMD